MSMDQSIDRIDQPLDAFPNNKPQSSQGDCYQGLIDKKAVNRPIAIQGVQTKIERNLSIYHKSNTGEQSIENQHLNVNRIKTQRLDPKLVGSKRKFKQSGEAQEFRTCTPTTTTNQKLHSPDKKLRRKKQNRQSAIRSRIKKKIEIDQMTSQIKELKEQRLMVDQKFDDMTGSLLKLMNENIALHRQTQRGNMQYTQFITYLSQQLSMKSLEIQGNKKNQNEQIQDIVKSNVQMYLKSHLNTQSNVFKLDDLQNLQNINVNEIANKTKIRQKVDKSDNTHILPNNDESMLMISLDSQASSYEVVSVSSQPIPRPTTTHCKQIKGNEDGITQPDPFEYSNSNHEDFVTKFLKFD